MGRDCLCRPRWTGLVQAASRRGADPAKWFLRGWALLLEPDCLSEYNPAPLLHGKLPAW